MLSGKLSFRNDKTNGCDVLDHAIRTPSARLEALRDILDPEENSEARHGPRIPWVSHIENLAGQAVNIFKVRDFMTVIALGRTSSLMAIPRSAESGLNLSHVPISVRESIGWLKRTRGRFSSSIRISFNQRVPRLRLCQIGEYLIEEETPRHRLEVELLNGE